MITIGIRAAPKAVSFAVYDSDAERVVNIEEICIPAAFETPDALKYLRSNLLDVLREFRVERAGIRITESVRNPNLERVQIEGVIQEAFASSGLRGYFIGQVASISARVGIERTAFKPMVEGRQAYPVEKWDTMSKEHREAVLAAIGAVNV